MNDNKLRIKFGTEVGVAGDQHEMITIWVNDKRFDGELISRNLPFYDTRFKMVKEMLIKKLVRHLIHHDLDLTPSEK